VVEQGDKILGKDGCLNFFAGPTNPEFKAEFNFYNVHYASTHIVGTSGGNTDDMNESIDLMAKGKINPAAMITHVGGRLCACGQSGCYEQYASAKALSRMAGGKTPEESIALAKAGDPGMASIWREYLAEVGAGLINLVWLFSPQRIVLGGGLSQAGDFLLNSLMECLNVEYGSMGLSTAKRICLSKFRNGAGYLGAVALAEITIKQGEDRLA
jgi:hypothetical protein